MSRLRWPDSTNSVSEQPGTNSIVLSKLLIVLEPANGLEPLTC